MRLFYDRNFRFRGFSESLENIVSGSIIMWTHIIGTFLCFFIMPLFTLFLIRANGNSKWNPRRSPIPFIIMNVIWILVAIMILSGDGHYLYDDPASTWTPHNFNDPANHNPIGRQ